MKKILFTLVLLLSAINANATVRYMTATVKNYGIEVVICGVDFDNIYVGKAGEIYCIHRSKLNISKEDLDLIYNKDATNELIQGVKIINDQKNTNTEKVMEDDFILNMVACSRVDYPEDGAKWDEIPSEK